MKFAASQVLYFLRNRSTQRNVHLLLRFIAVLTLLVFVYSVLFHYLVAYEMAQGLRNHGESFVTGLYWTLTVMTTLGFGDITFASDLGKIFSMLVLMSGIIFLLVLLPFTFIQFFYAPWMEAQAAARAPRFLPPRVAGHVILTHDDAVTRALMRKLEQYHYQYVLLVGELEEALRLHDQGLRVVLGDRDSPETYRRLQGPQAALVATTATDPINTNIAFTVREVAPDVPILATAHEAASVDILALAGCNHVLQLHEMLGQSLARRTRGGDSLIHEIGRFDQLIIAEALVSGTRLVGQTLLESRLREEVGLTLVGVWEYGQFALAQPTTTFGPNTVLVLAGSPDQMERFNRIFLPESPIEGPVIIIGGGRVGRATQRALDDRGLPSVIIERLPEHVRDPARTIVGSAAELEVLQRAGIEQAQAVILTTHDDDINIYLTIYCRRLRPEIQVISRATEERNIQTLHRAGADLVMSYASMGANTIFNLLQRSDILMVAEGLNIFRVTLPASLQGVSLKESSIRARSGCSVIAVQSAEGIQINPDPVKRLEAGSELILVGDMQAEGRFQRIFGG
ncbi:MAG: Glutathione-regulated potassium-efflux system protein KefC [candidate division BRC1 bacterium ADurb.BinA292]|nr:MAG: Glutathione-regulated potassium-efflux system protein KefC [candidate division BRC1 bacterium ADurb.BinA292]